MSHILEDLEDFVEFGRNFVILIILGIKRGVGPLQHHSVEEIHIFYNNNNNSFI